MQMDCKAFYELFGLPTIQDHRAFPLFESRSQVFKLLYQIYIGYLCFALVYSALWGLPLLLFVMAVSKMLKQINKKKYYPFQYKRYNKDTLGTWNPNPILLQHTYMYQYFWIVL